MKSRVAIDVCCNNPDNGVFAGRAWQIQWEDAEFEADDFDGYRFTDAGGFFRMHRRKFPIVSSKEYVGNWCWNRYVIERGDAKRLLAVMASSGFWHCTCAPVRISNWFDRRRSQNMAVAA